MKGTLFSSDFIKDSTGALKLIEINTDTSVVSNKISSIDLTEFISVLQANNITTLEIIYKPFIQKGIVAHIKEQVEANAPFITTINLHDEDRNSIYPVTLTDSPEKFILRLSYDEAAILDSIYAKSSVNLFNLFYNSSEQNRVVNYYHSSSAGIKNSLSYELNSGVLPDVAVKDVDELFNPIDFYKIGSEVDGESNEDRWNGLINQVKAEDKLIQQYHFHSSSLDENNKVTSYRQVSIVYGPSLELIHLTSYKTSAVLSLPTSIDGEFNSSVYVNKLGDHHYYEYTTSFPSAGSAGVLDSHKVLMYPSGAKELSLIEVGDQVLSYYISGSPNVETNLEVSSYSFSGDTMPSGSYLTASSVVFIEKDDPKYRGMVELTVDGESIYSGVKKQYLVYNSGSGLSRFVEAIGINPDTDYFFDLNGSLIDIDEANLFITLDTDSKFAEIDVEDSDTYLISGSTAFNAVVSHNAPCFIAGTKIASAEGEKNIEDVKVGDKVSTYNFKTGKVEEQEVLGLGQKKVAEVVKYTLSNGEELTATTDHPLYSPVHGWISSNPDYTQSVYSLKTTQAFIGCEIQLLDGATASIKSIEISKVPTHVYNLRCVDANHNFFANNVLVHNRVLVICFVAGTEISTGIDTTVKIEDIKPGDSVLTYNLEEGRHEVGTVGELRTHQTDSVVRLTLDNEIVITTTSEHPFYVESKGWVKAGELEVLDTCLTVKGEKAIISTVEVLEETHTVYNLINVSTNHNFFANSILVHNKL